MTKQTIVITGASSGIGLATALHFAKKPDNQVHIFDVQEPTQPIPDNVTYHNVNVTNTQSITKALATIQNIDILLNNAGIMIRTELFNIEEEDFDKLLAVNFKSYWLTTKLALPKLSQNAQVLFVSSTHAIYPPSNPAIYALSKMAVNDMYELLQRGYPNLTTKLVIPGPVETPMADIGESQDVIHKQRPHRASPQTVAEKIVQLSQSHSKKLICDMHRGEYYFSS